LKNFPATEKSGEAQADGRKGRGFGGRNFRPSALPAEGGLGREAARPCVSKEAKPAKIVSLIEKIFCARSLKNVSIFAGSARRQAASRWAGLPPTGRQLKVAVRIFVKKSSDSVQKVPPSLRRSSLERRRASLSFGVIKSASIGIRKKAGKRLCITSTA